MLKLLVCDWDGTLCDSVEPITRCKRALAKKYQLPEPTNAQVRAALGLPLKAAFAHSFPSANAQTRDRIQDDFHQLMLTPDYHATLFKHVMPFIKKLRAQGTHIAIATSKSRNELNHSLNENHCNTLFDASCSGEEYKPKPHALMVEHLLNEFQCSPQDALLIGDSVCDIEMATNAKIRAIAVTFGAGDLHQLLAAKPYAVAHDWRTLTELVAQL